MPGTHESNTVLPRRTCGTMQVHHRLLEADPEFRIHQGEMEHAFHARLAGPLVRPARAYKINVVVHVVWSNASENISDKQVVSQISALNRDYRMKNRDVTNIPEVWRGLAVDTRIGFALAKTDPNGNATSGIVRTRTTRPSFYDDDSVKAHETGGADPWPTDRYLNLWVCNLTGGLLGYAQFPGGARATDGVVIRNTAFGTSGTAARPFNLGRTATHEIGHYLNLRHIWGDTEDCGGTDYVDDTPRAQHPNYHAPEYPHVSCGNGPDGDMFMNYMDYVDDAAMVMFTRGQTLRMHTALDGPRASLMSR